MEKEDTSRYNRCRNQLKQQQPAVPGRRKKFFRIHFTKSQQQLGEYEKRGNTFMKGFVGASSGMPEKAKYPKTPVNIANGSVQFFISFSIYKYPF